MIKFGDGNANFEALINQYAKNSPEAEILKRLSESSTIYTFSSPDELRFEAGLRKNIIDASIALYRGRLGFRTFRESRCNEAFWNRREDGGFVLKQNVKPSEAIRDIYKNSRKYATECATTIMIVYYGAVLESFGEELFNAAFPEITLMNWMQTDELLGVETYRRPGDYLPGDCRYFRNPDVNPLTPEWQGENAIDLNDGIYYGHGIGLASKDRIIAELNRNRIEGAQASAYLMETATRPDFSGLYHYKRNASLHMPTLLPGIPLTTTQVASPASTTPAAPASAPAPIIPSEVAAAPAHTPMPVIPPTGPVSAALVPPTAPTSVVPPVVSATPAHTPMPVIPPTGPVSAVPVSSTAPHSAPPTH